MTTPPQSTAPKPRSPLDYAQVLITTVPLNDTAPQSQPDLPVTVIRPLNGELNFLSHLNREDHEQLWALAHAVAASTRSLDTTQAALNEQVAYALMFFTLHSEASLELGLLFPEVPWSVDVFERNLKRHVYAKQRCFSVVDHRRQDVATALWDLGRTLSRLDRPVFRQSPLKELIPLYQKGIVVFDFSLPAPPPAHAALGSAAKFSRAGTKLTAFEEVPSSVWPPATIDLCVRLTVALVQRATGGQARIFLKN